MRNDIPTLAEVRQAIRRAPNVYVEIAIIEDIGLFRVTKAQCLRYLEAREDNPWSIFWDHDGDLILGN